MQICVVMRRRSWGPDSMRTRLLGRLATAVVVALFGEPAVSAAARSILVLAPSPNGGRIEPAHEAIAFWNEWLEELGVETRLAGPRLVVASPVNTRARELRPQRGAARRPPSGRGGGTGCTTGVNRSGR